MRRQKSGSYRNNQMVYVNYRRHVLQYINYSVRFDGNDDNVTAPHHFAVINASVNAQRLPQKYSVTARSIQLENGKCSLSCQWFRQEAQLSQDRVMIRCVVEILSAAAQLYEKLHFQQVHIRCITLKVTQGQNHQSCHYSIAQCLYLAPFLTISPQFYSVHHCL